MISDDEAEREGLAIARSFKSARPRAGSRTPAPIKNCGAVDTKRLHAAQLKTSFAKRQEGLNDSLSPAMMAYLNETNAQAFSFSKRDCDPRLD
jgi:hypothetical protein